MISINGDNKIFPDYMVLDDIIKLLEIIILVNIDIIKIDVEGFEMNVLRAAEYTIKKYKPKIIIETHSFNLFYEVRDFLTNIGYELKHRDYNTSEYSNNFYII